jgi:hypothetical protein
LHDAAVRNTSCLDPRHANHDHAGGGTARVDCDYCLCPDLSSYRFRKVDDIAAALAGAERHGGERLL